MGGQNHKPTHKRTIAVSAWLSQRVSEGFALVLQANSHLENAIILGMDKLHVDDLARQLSGPSSDHVERALVYVERSEVTLAEIRAGFGRVLTVACIEGYTGNPLADQLVSFDLKSKFQGLLLRPFVNNTAWQQIEGRLQTTNVLKTLEWEGEQFSQLLQPTRALIEVLRQCLDIARTRDGRALVDAIENNEIPLRQYYAQVFSLWNSLHAMFLYSSLMTTKLFYRVNAYRSLLEFDSSAEPNAA